MKTFHLGAIVLMSIGLAACSGSSETAAVASTDDVAPAGATVVAPAPVDRLSKKVVSDAVQFQPEAARVDGDALASTGMPGFVMFGPYIPLAPGNYHVTVHGSIPAIEPGAQVRFDVVSGAATDIHGEQVVTIAAPDAASIASFDIAVPQGVTDLEVRAQVTEGVDMRIDSYQVVKAN